MPSSTQPRPARRPKFLPQFTWEQLFCLGMTVSLASTFSFILGSFFSASSGNCTSYHNKFSAAEPESWERQPLENLKSSSVNSDSPAHSFSGMMGQFSDFYQYRRQPASFFSFDWGSLLDSHRLKNDKKNSKMRCDKLNFPAANTFLDQVAHVETDKVKNFIQ